MLAFLFDSFSQLLGLRIWGTTLEYQLDCLDRGQLLDEEKSVADECLRSMSTWWDGDLLWIYGEINGGFLRQIS